MNLFKQTTSNQKVVLNIAGMHCPTCVDHVRKALRKARGVHDVQIQNWTDARATVQGENPSVEDLLKLAQEAGYPATVHSQSTASSREESTESIDVDLAVIGTGAAGMAAALKAAGAGRSVVLIEKGTLGGTCVNIGCIPSKTLIRAAEAAHVAQAHPFRGVDTTLTGIDWNTIRSQKDELVAELRQSKYLEVLSQFQEKITLKRGQARFLDARTLKLDNGDVIRFHKAIIATGARPRKLKIAGALEDSFLDSTSLMALSRLPKSLLVIGGRVIALELGQAFARLGTRVTILQRSGRLLPDHEPEIGEGIATFMREEGIEVITEATPLELSSDAPVKKLKVRVKAEEKVIEAEEILMAVGRTPNTQDMGLEDLGVKTDADGFIVVDASLQTSVDGIYAAGDVTTYTKLVYLAAKAGSLAASNALDLAGDGLRQELDIRVLPDVIFTDPQVATVGLTEAAAASMGYEVQVANLPLAYVPRAKAARNTKGFIKLVADKKTDRLLGAHIVGADAGEVIQTAAMAIQMGYLYGFKLEQLRDMFFPYLVQVEGLKLAAQSLTKDIKTLSCCAG